MFPAATNAGGNLFARIYRLTGRSKNTPEKFNWLVPILAILLMVSVLVLVTLITVSPPLLAAPSDLFFR